MTNAWRLFAFAVLPLAAQDTTNVSAVRKAQTDVQQILVRGDAAALGNILTEDFVRTPPDGIDTNKSEYISQIAAGRLKYLSTDNIEDRYRAYGNTVLVNTLTNVRYRANGAERLVKLKVMWVWVRQAGQWRLAAVQGTEVRTN